MTYYNSLISSSLAQKLRDAGYPLESEAKTPTFAEVFDWFARRDIWIAIIPVELGGYFVYDYEVSSFKHHDKDECIEHFDRAAELAIETVLSWKE